MRPPWIVRVLSRLTPARWRASVVRDLIEDADARHLSGLGRTMWLTFHLLTVLGRLHGRALHSALPRPRALLTGFSADVSAAMRHLRSSPGATVLAIGTLSLGVAAVVTVATILYRTVIVPVPFTDADRLVALWRIDPASPQNWLATTPGDFVDWDREAGSFESLAAARNVSHSYTATEIGGAPLMRRVTHDWLDTLGITPAMGREFTAEEDRPNGPNVAVLSYATWQQRFAGRADVVGQAVELDRVTYTIVGVLPSTYYNPVFGLVDQPEVLLPLGLAAAGESRNLGTLLTVGRLKPGVTLQDARSEIDRLAERQAQEFPASNSNVRATTQPIGEQLVRPVRTPLTLLFAAVLGLFIAACGNVANLNLVRTLARRRDHAVRQALGASRARLVLQVLSENSIVALAAGVVAVGLTALAGPAAARLTPPGFLAPTVNFTLDPMTLVIAGVVTMVTAIASSLPSLWTASRRLAAADLSAGVSRAVGSRDRRRWASALIAIELAVATVLLAGAGLATTGFDRLSRSPLGFDPDNALSFRVSTRGPEFTTPESRFTFFERVLEELRTLPGSQAVGGMNALPVFTQFGERGMYRADRPDVPPPGAEPRVTVIPVTDGFFAAMGMRLAEGRDISMTDREDTPRVVVLSRAAATRLFGADAAVGRPLALPEGTAIRRLDVVGLVDDVRSMTDPTTSTAVAYVPMRQAGPPGAFGFVLRSSEPLAGLVRQAEAAVHRVNRSSPLYLARPLSEVAAGLQATARFTTALMLTFAAIGLVLVASGLFGTVAQLVADRRRELGVRLALGATRVSVLALVLRDGLRPALTGIGIGLVGAVVAGRIMAGFVPGTPSFVAVVFATLPAVLLGLCVTASLIPAMRATRVDPTTALRPD